MVLNIIWPLLIFCYVVVLEYTSAVEFAHVQIIGSIPNMSLENTVKLGLSDKPVQGESCTKISTLP